MSIPVSASQCPAPPASVCQPRLGGTYLARAVFQSLAHVSGLLLQANTVAQCSGNCYSFGSGTGLVMRDSVMLRDTSTRYFM